MQQNVSVARQERARPPPARRVTSVTITTTAMREYVASRILHNASQPVARGDT